MTNEDRIRALEKIASSDEANRAFLEGALSAHEDHAKSRHETADSLSGWGNTVGIVGGGAGGLMTLKGLKQMFSKGPSIAPAGVKHVYYPGGPYAGLPTQSAMKMVPTGALTATEPRFSAIVSRPKVTPKLKGKKLALKGGLLGLGSLGVSEALRGMARSNRDKANEHTKSLEQIKDQLR